MESSLLIIPLAALSFITGWLFLVSLTIHPAKLYSRVLLFGILLTVCIFMIVIYKGSGGITERIDQQLKSFQPSAFATDQTV